MAKRNYRCHIYQDLIGEWRWRITASNGRIVADSGEGYLKVQMCKRDVVRLQKMISEMEIAIDGPHITE
jgi:uncharacterized protein YegP (UPF0339 family)